MSTPAPPRRRRHVAAEAATNDELGAGEDAPLAWARRVLSTVDVPFAQVLLGESGFGPGEAIARDDMVPGDRPTDRLLPRAITYWPRQPGRPFHILLFQLEIGARALLDDPFFHDRDTLDDALHRIAQDALAGFARGDAAREQGAPTETLCVVAVADDRAQPDPTCAVCRGRGRPGRVRCECEERRDRQVVCFATSCVATGSMEAFTLREEVRDWDRPLAEEHLEQLFKRHFRRLGDGTRWQDAFVSGPERTRAETLVAACRRPDRRGERQRALEDALFLLLDQLALSFDIARTREYDGQPASLELEDLPTNHGVAIHGRKGVRIFDSSDRLLGYIVHAVDTKGGRDQHHFDNVLVIDADEGGGTVELWQGPEPLRGRLTAGADRSRFDGPGGVVQLLSRFFVVRRSFIAGPERLAGELAWRARHLKAIALDELKRELGAKRGPLYTLYSDFNQALARQTPEQFADTYAQTITYGLLAARWLARDKLTRFTRARAMKLLPSTSEFLRDLFDRLIHEDYDADLTWLLDDITGLLSRTLVREVFRGQRDPSIHFYQDFLDAYDPGIRRRMGVYYTPDEVVQYIVRVLDRLARTRLGLRLGLADPITWGEYARQRGIDKPAGVEDGDFVVQILDPAAGTGTFMLHVLELVFRTMTAEFAALGLDDEQAAAAWKAYVRAALLPRLHAFELMMAPYVVSHLRLGLALEQGLAEQTQRDPSRWGFTFAKQDRLRVFLTNTLELHARPRRDGVSEHVAEETREAERLKTDTAVLVVLGNPPYERVAADTDATAAWVLEGKVPGRTGEKSLFDDIHDVAREHTIFSHHASLYDRYVYFWRWALWKAFERPESPGMVGFITNATWLTGPGFVGLRQLARQLGDEIWTVDLGGDNRGANSGPNVFNIETPVAITTVVRAKSSRIGPLAPAYYRKIHGGSREDKIKAVAALLASDDPLAGDWTRVTPGGATEALVPPSGGAAWVRMPALADLFPWQQPGCKYGRLWPIATDIETLVHRWTKFTTAKEAERPVLFYTGTSGRNIYTCVRGLRRLVDEAPGATHPPIRRYGYRSFDRQWAFADPRMAKTESPSLWAGWSCEQLFLIAPMTKVTSAGPCLVATACVPDLDHFRGSFGGKDVIPLYRDAAARQPNITAGLLPRIGEALGLAAPSPAELAAYVYAVLSALRYQQRFAAALRTPGPRVPLTRDPTLWTGAVALGERLLWLHTYAERLRDAAGGRGDALPGVPGLDWTTPVTVMPDRPNSIKYDATRQLLTIGDGTVAGVRSDVWGYAVSGMQVVPRWLGYRTAKGAGRAASSSNPLAQIRPTTWPEAWSRELLELLTVLTLTMDLQPGQGALLDAICDGPLIPAGDLPQPAPAERREPKVRKSNAPTLV